MAHGMEEWAECPQCGFIAYGRDDIEEYFGYRYDGTKPQSWCKSCRSGGTSISDEDDIPEGCVACGGPYPNCKWSCPMFDE